MKRMLLLVLSMFFVFGIQVAFACKADYCPDGFGSDASTPPTKYTPADLAPKPPFHQANMNPFLPKDIAIMGVDRRGVPCDQNGNNNQNEIYGACSNSRSKSANAMYRTRISGRDGDSIFIMQNHKPVLYVQFAGNNDVMRIVYMSKEAERFAESNGYRFDQRNSTMVAMNEQSAPTATASTMDCTHPQGIQGSLACARTSGGRTNGTRAPDQQPTPVVTANQGQDCSQVQGFLAKAKCIANSAK